MPDAKRILVVDDEVLMRQVMVSLLEDVGFVVAEAADGQHAIDWLESGSAADLVLLDIGMPRVDGWGVLAHIEMMAVRPHVVVQSGRGEVVPPGHLGQYVCGFLSKPFTGSQLLLMCETALAAAPIVPAGGSRAEDRRNSWWT